MEKLLVFEKKAYDWMAKNGIVLLRISIGIVFFWYGIQKFFPGVSSAEDIATLTIEKMTFGFVTQSLSMPLLAIWEVVIGLAFISGFFIRIALPLLLLQMIGTFMPLVIFPEKTFEILPFIPTLTGQYIIKNIIVVTGAFVIGAYHMGLLRVSFKRPKS